MSTMAIYPSFSVLVDALCVSALTQGEEVVGRTRLGSLFKNGWLAASYGSPDNKIIAPVYQRELTWSLAKQRDFIINILGNDMKSIGHFVTFNKRANNKFPLLDGQHRITTVQKFINEEFAVTIGNRKNVMYSDLTEEEQEKIENIIVDIKIHNLLTEEQERNKYLQLNNASAPSNTAQLHALRSSDARQPMFQLCDDIMAGTDQSSLRIRELLKLGTDTKAQTCEGKILPFLSVLITGNKLPNKQCAALTIPEDMSERLNSLVEATENLDSAKADLTRFLGPIAHDIATHNENPEEIRAIIARWASLIRQDKVSSVWNLRMVHDRPRWNRDAKRPEFEARCIRIRELYAPDGTYLLE